MLKIPSDLNELQNTEQLVKKIFEQYRLDMTLFPNILICIMEAITNAIVHGNEKNHNKYVTISTKYEKEHLHVRITDEGAGFDPCAIPDPTLPENIYRSGGRGVFIIHQLTDYVSFKDEGKTIEMVYKIKTHTNF